MFAPRERAKFFAYVPQRGEPVRLTVFDAVLLGRRPHLGWAVERRDLEKVESALESLSLERFASVTLTSSAEGSSRRSSWPVPWSRTPGTAPRRAHEQSRPEKPARHAGHLRKVVKGHGVVALLSLHDLNTAFRYADRLLFLKDGCIRGMFLPSEVPGEIIAEVYGVPVDIVRHKGVPLVVPS